MKLADIVLVDDGDLGPIEVDDQLAQRLADDRRTGVEVDRELFDLRLQVEPRLDVRNVQCIAQALNVPAEQQILRPEDGCDAARQQRARPLRGVEAVLARHVLNVVDERRVLQQRPVLVDSMYRVLEGKLRGTTLLVFRE